MNKNNQQTNEIKLSREFAERIKKRWEELAERQKSSGHPLHSGRKITEVSFVKDHHGKTAVQIGLRNGRSIRDNGQEKVFDKFKEQNGSTYIRLRVSEFLRKIREYGYAAVEGEIPAELKEAVLKGMEKANISTSYKGAKAEAAAKQNAQSILKANIENAARQTGSHLTPYSQKDSRPYSIKTTPEMEKAMAKGVAFILPPLHNKIRTDVIPLVEKTTAETLDTAARMTEKMAVSTIQYNRIASESVTATTTDGRKITGTVIELASKDAAQQAYLRLLDKPHDKYTDNDKKLESFMLATLKHKGIVPKDSAEIPADKINAAKEYISLHVAELPSKKASAFFPEDLKQQYQAAKAKEKEIRAKQDNDLEMQSGKRKIKEALAATPTLLSEIVSGKKKSSDYSFNDVMQDLRNHPKSGDRLIMARLLHLSMQNNPNLTKETKIPQECMQKNIDLFKKYKAQTALEPQLKFQKFLEREGLVSQKNNQGKQRAAAPTKKNLSASAEAERVSDKLRQNIRHQENIAKTVPVQTKIAAGEKKKLSPMQIAMIKKQRNDFAR